MFPGRAPFHSGGTNLTQPLSSVGKAACDFHPTAQIHPQAQLDESVYVGDRVIVLTPGPGRVRADLPVSLPEPRDQITTKELPDFVRLRTEVSRLVRSRDTRAVT